MWGEPGSGPGPAEEASAWELREEEEEEGEDAGAEAEEPPPFTHTPLLLRGLCPERIKEVASFCFFHLLFFLGALCMYVCSGRASADGAGRGWGELGVDMYVHTYIHF